MRSSFGQGVELCLGPGQGYDCWRTGPRVEAMLAANRETTARAAAGAPAIRPVGVDETVNGVRQCLACEEVNVSHRLFEESPDRLDRWPLGVPGPGNISARFFANMLDINAILR